MAHRVIESAKRGPTVPGTPRCANGVFLFERFCEMRSGIRRFALYTSIVGRCLTLARTSLRQWRALALL